MILLIWLFDFVAFGLETKPLSICLTFEHNSDVSSSPEGHEFEAFRIATNHSIGGSRCLAVAIPKTGEEYISHLEIAPFDLMEMPTMSFDYKQVATTKVVFQLRIAERDFRIGVSGGERANAGIPTNVCVILNAEILVGDGTWHTAIIDLRRLLRMHTRLTSVKQVSVIVGGVSDSIGPPLLSGKGDALYIDNVRISGPPCDRVRGQTMIDDFESLNKHRAGFFGSPNCKGSKLDMVSVPVKSRSGTVVGNHALSFQYNVEESGAYAGFWHQIPVADISNYGTVRCRLHCEGQELPPLEVSVLWLDNVLGKCFAVPFASKPDEDGWREVAIPVGALVASGGFSRAKSISFSVANDLGCTHGTFLVDDIRLDTEYSFTIADFEAPSSWNCFVSGGCVTKGPAAVSALVVSDEADRSKESNRVCRISFGGSLGSPLADSAGDKAQCYWECPLYGADGRMFKEIVFRIRGRKGGESVCFYLVDGGCATHLTQEDLVLTKDWRELRIDLDSCAVRGIDISLLTGLWVSFEGDGQTGTVYVDNFRFEGKR